MRDADGILEELGRFGQHQMIALFLIGLVCMRNAWHPFISVFMAADTPFVCVAPAYTSSSVNNSLAKHGQNNITDMEECYYTSADSDESLCGQWQFDMSEGSTIVTEWSLVCGRAGLVPLSTSLFMAGVMVGTVFLAPLADRWGRKMFLIVCVLAQSLMGLGLAFVHSFELFCALRFFMGMLNQCAAVAGFVLLTEQFCARARTTPCTLLNVFWPLGLVLLAAMAYLIKDWRHLNLAVSVPCLPIVIYHWLLPESVPWLISKNRTDEAEAALKLIASRNGKTFSDAVSRNHEQHELSPRTEPEPAPKNQSENGAVIVGFRQNVVAVVQKYPQLLLFSTRKMSLYSILIFYMWAVNSLSYYGLSFSLAEFSGDRYVNFILVSLVEVPAQVASVFILARFGRRPVLCVFYVVGGLAVISSVLIPKLISDVSVVVLVCGLVGKFCVTVTMITMYLYSAEVFPTVVRNSGLGLASFFETLGSVAAPFVVYSENWLSFLPPTVYGCMSVSAGLLVLCLPETQNKALPETVHDVEVMTNKSP